MWLRVIRAGTGRRWGFSGKAQIALQKSSALNYRSDDADVVEFIAQQFHYASQCNGVEPRWMPHQ